MLPEPLTGHFGGNFEVFEDVSKKGRESIEAPKYRVLLVSGCRIHSAASYLHS